MKTLQQILDDIKIDLKENYYYADKDNQDRFLNLLKEEITELLNSLVSEEIKTKKEISNRVGEHHSEIEYKNGYNQCREELQDKINNILK